MLYQYESHTGIGRSMSKKLFDGFQSAGGRTDTDNKKAFLPVGTIIYFIAARTIRRDISLARHASPIFPACIAVTYIDDREPRGHTYYLPFRISLILAGLKPFTRKNRILMAMQNNEKQRPRARILPAQAPIADFTLESRLNSTIQAY